MRLEEKACFSSPSPRSLAASSLLPRAWANLPASFRLISFNTPIRLPWSLLSHFLAPQCSHLQTKGAAPCLPQAPEEAGCSVGLSEGTQGLSPECPLQVPQESPATLWGHLCLAAGPLELPVSSSTPLPHFSLAAPPGPGSSKGRPPPRVHLCTSPAWPQVHHLWVPRDTGLIHLPSGQTLAWLVPVFTLDN